MLKTNVKRPYELYNYINKKPSEGTVSIANYFLLNLLAELMGKEFRIKQEEL